MKANRVVIGTRGSQLAMWQAHWAQAELKRHFKELAVDIEVIKTQGDRLSEVPLSQMGGKEVWTKEIEAALLEGHIDLAVHSLKDLPTQLPSGLRLGAISAREDVRDVLIGQTFDCLKEGAHIGTSSLRRQAQILHLRPDLHIEAIRGNVDTRLRKLNTEGFDAIVLASAGLRRLGLTVHISEYLDPEHFLPAPGQAALGIEIRDHNEPVMGLITVLNDENANRAVTAERAMLAALGGGCRVPIGGLAVCQKGKLILTGMVAMPDGSRLLRESLMGNQADPAELGMRVAEKLHQQGAEDILKTLTDN